MTIATDPNSDSLENEQDDFAKHFEEFASGKKPDPDTEKTSEADPSEGNDPGDEPPSPEEEQKAEPEAGEEEAPAAEEEDKSSEEVTSDDAKPEGGSQPPEGEAPDPWADAPPELIAERDRLQKEKEAAEHKANSDAARVAALSRKLHQLTVGQASSANKAPEAKPTEAQKALDEKISQLRKDYGEIADPLIELIESQRKELSEVRTSLAGMSEAQQAQVVAQETAALEKAHPDWRTIAQSPDFAGWLEVQPENIQRLAQSWDARETSVVLTLFKTERAETAGQKGQSGQPPKQEQQRQDAQTQKASAATGARRSQQLDGGRDVRSRPAPAASEAPDDFDAAFKYFEEKRRAKALAGSPRQ